MLGPKPNLEKIMAIFQSIGNIFTPFCKLFVEIKKAKIVLKIFDFSKKK